MVALLVVEDNTATDDFLEQVKTLERIYRSSNQTDVRNLLRKDSGFKQTFDTYEKDLDDLLAETKKIILDVVSDRSISFYKRSEFLDDLFHKWTKLHSRVRDKVDQIGIVKSIDLVTDYVIAYCYLCKSLYLINEKKTGDYYTDLVYVNEGLELLCSVIEVFYGLIGESTVSQIDMGVKSIIAGFKDRSIKDYFHEGFDKNILVTRFKSLCTFLLSLTEVRLKETKVNKINEEALNLIDSWRKETIDDQERGNRKEDFEYLAEIVDSNRIPGQGVFSS